MSRQVLRLKANCRASLKANCRASLRILENFVFRHARICRCFSSTLKIHYRFSNTTLDAKCWEIFSYLRTLSRSAHVSLMNIYFSVECLSLSIFIGISMKRPEINHVRSLSLLIFRSCFIASIFRSLLLINKLASEV